MSGNSPKITSQPISVPVSFADDGPTPPKAGVQIALKSNPVALPALGRTPAPPPPAQKPVEVPKTNWFENVLSASRSRVQKIFATLFGAVDAVAQWAKSFFKAPEAKQEVQVARQESPTMPGTKRGRRTQGAIAKQTPNVAPKASSRAKPIEPEKKVTAPQVESGFWGSLGNGLQNLVRGFGGLAKNIVQPELPMVSASVRPEHSARLESLIIKQLREKVDSRAFDPLLVKILTDMASGEYYSSLKIGAKLGIIKDPKNPGKKWDELAAAWAVDLFKRSTNMDAEMRTRDSSHFGEYRKRYYPPLDGTLDAFLARVEFKDDEERSRTRTLLRDMAYAAWTQDYLMDAKSYHAGAAAVAGIVGSKFYHGLDVGRIEYAEAQELKQKQDAQMIALAPKGDVGRSARTRKP